MKRANSQNLNTEAYWNYRYSQEVEDMWRIWTTRDLIEKVSAHIPHRASVLDVGCGAGIVPTRMSKIRSDIQLSACDFSLESIKYLHSLPLSFNQLFQADLRVGLPCPDQSFDVVLATEVLEHLEFSAEAVLHLVRVARDRVVITVPNKDAIPSPEHVIEFDAQDLTSLLSPYGVVTVETCREERNLIGVCQLCR